MTSFKFTPKTEDELSELLAEGEAGFEIIKAEYKISRKNKPMFVLKLRVWDVNGEEGTIDDYLTLDESSKFGMRKLKHLYESIGLKAVYESGSADIADFESRSGKLRLGIQKNRKDDDGKPLPQRNCVWDYLEQIIDQSNLPELNDDIPAFN